MRLRSKCWTAGYCIGVGLIAAGCGHAPKSFDVSVKHSSTTLDRESSMKQPDPVDVFGAASLAIGQRQIETFTWAAAENQAKTAATSTPRTSPVASLNATVSAAAPSLGNCGGDLPPCYVKQRESGGSYTAVNPTGCGGESCGGAWQFAVSTWNDYGGYHYAQDAPPEVQDAKAREVWAGGAGCSHWSACG